MTPEELNERIKTVARRHGVPAVAVAMVTESGSYTFVSGVRKHGTSTPASRKDKFLLATTSEFLTRIVLARLVDQGVINWTDTIFDIMTEYQQYMDPGHRNTTIEMLSSDGFGISEDTPNLRDAEDGALYGYITKRSVNARDGREAILLSYLGKPPDQPPGSVSLPMIQSTLLLAFILEHVTGVVFEELMKREVLEPLGMLESGFGQPAIQNGRDRSGSAPVQPWPHRPGTFGKRWSTLEVLDPVEHDLPPVMNPSSGVHTSTSDLTRLLSFCLDGKDSLGMPLLSVESRAKLFASFWSCMYTHGGLFVASPDVDDGEKGSVYTRSGRGSGFTARLWIAPAAGKAFWVMTNFDGRRGRDVLIEIASELCSIQRLILGMGTS